MLGVKVGRRTDSVGITEFVQRLAISPYVLSISMDVVIDKCIIINGFISLNKMALTVLVALMVMTSILGAIWPGFNAFTMLIITEPVAFV